MAAKAIYFNYENASKSRFNRTRAFKIKHNLIGFSNKKHPIFGLTKVLYMKHQKLASCLVDLI